MNAELAEISVAWAAKRARIDECPRGAELNISQLQDYASDLAAALEYLNNALWRVQRIDKRKESS